MLWCCRAQLFWWRLFNRLESSISLLYKKKKKKRTGLPSHIYLVPKLVYIYYSCHYIYTAAAWCTTCLRTRRPLFLLPLWEFFFPPWKKFLIFCREKNLPLLRSLSISFVVYITPARFRRRGVNSSFHSFNRCEILCRGILKFLSFFSQRITKNRSFSER